MNKTQCRRVLAAFRAHSSKKYISLDDMSRWTGFYVDVLTDYFSYFDPMCALNQFFNCKDLEQPIAEYLEKLEAETPKTPRKPAVRNKELSKYKSIHDFAYKKMTYGGGLVDPSGRLSDEDLAILAKLVEREEKRRKKAASSKKGAKKARKA